MSYIRTWTVLVFLSAAFVLHARSAAVDPFAAVAASIQPYVDRGEISGAVMLVADKERILHVSAVGQSNVKSARPMKTDDLFWIASMSKPITAAAVAILVDDGKIGFDDPVEKYLPEFREQWVAQEQSAASRVLVKPIRPITIRDLLTHVSGTGEYIVTDPHWSLSEMTKVIAREPLQFQPGSRWGYSTAGTDVLGRLVEVVSKVPFADFLRQRLFQPLGMKDTTFWPTREQEKRLAQDYRLDPVSGKLEEITIGYLYGGAITDRRRPALGGAGLFSTAGEMAKFYQMMLKEGMWNERRILKAETVAELTDKQTGRLKARPGMPWGLGFCVIEDPSQMEANVTLSAGTFGHGGAHGTNSWADPVRGIVYVLMIQRDGLQPNPDDSPIRRTYQQAVAAALAK
jgi:CubicO group peptidase (beta-lactamase class C family)